MQTVERCWFDVKHTRHEGIWAALAGMGREMAEKKVRPLRVVKAEANDQPYDGVITYKIEVEVIPGKPDRPFYQWWFEKQKTFDQGFADAAPNAVWREGRFIAA